MNFFAFPDSHAVAPKSSRIRPATSSRVLLEILRERIHKCCFILVSILWPKNHVSTQICQKKTPKSGLIGDSQTSYISIEPSKSATHSHKSAKSKPKKSITLSPKKKHKQSWQKTKNKIIKKCIHHPLIPLTPPQKKRKVWPFFASYERPPAA